MPTDEVHPEFTYVHPDKLQFDPTNPRFGGTGEGKRQDEIQGLLEKEPHFALQLIDSFLENGFIDYEPLVVRREADHFIVVEGNRRLAAVRHILSRRDEYDKKSTRIDDLLSIPVLVFPPISASQDNKEQRVYLGVRHLFGFREWPAESKARYLDANITNSDDLDRIMRELNIKKAEISRYLVPFRVRKKAQNSWQPYRNQDFWVLGEALTRTGIREYVELTVDNSTLEVKRFNDKRFKLLLQFIYGTPEAGKVTNRRIRETRDLSTLARVLQSKRAGDVLEKGKPLEEATLFLESRPESLARLSRLLTQLRVLLKRVLVGKLNQQSVKAVASSFDRFEKNAKKLIKDAKKSDI